MRGGNYFFKLPAVNTEQSIRDALGKECKKRGKQAEIAKIVDVSQSTVKRWLEGGEIGAPALRLLDWYFFGVVPPRLAKLSDAQAVLEFDEAEWAVIGAAARREGTTESAWIAGRIRAYIRYELTSPGETSSHLKVANDPAEYGSGDQQAQA